MAEPQQEVSETERMLATVGIHVTAEGKARARARLAEADAKMPPVKWDELRNKYFRYSSPA